MCGAARTGKGKARRARPAARNSRTAGWPRCAARPARIEQDAVEQDERRGDPAGAREHEVLGVGDHRDVGAENAAERLVQPRQDAAEVLERRLLPVGHLHDPSGLRRRARPATTGARWRPRSGTTAHRRMRPPSARADEDPEARRGHGARRHEVRPQREAGAAAPAGRACRAAAGPAPRRGAAPPAPRVRSTTPHSEQRRRVEGRRQRREQQEVGRRAGDEHGRRQGRRGVQPAREAVGHGHEQEPEQEVRAGAAPRWSCPQIATKGRRPTSRAASRRAGPTSSCRPPGAGP